MSIDYPSSLGEYLRQERERLGITLEQVASATKIGVRTLQAFESDHYSELPAKPFIRGFIISYSRFIGLDAKDILTHYNSFLDERAKDRPNREAGHSGYAFERREGEQSRTVLWFVMGAFILIGGVVILFLKPSLHHHRGQHVERLKAVQALVTTTPEPEASSSASPSVEAASPRPGGPAPASAAEAPMPSPTAEVVALTAVSAAPSPSPSPSPIPFSALPPAIRTNGDPDLLHSGKDLFLKDVKYRVIFKALESVMVRYQVDERPAMKFILKKDKLLVLRSIHGIRFQVVDPSVITYTFNGRPTQRVSDSNDAVNLSGIVTLFFPQQYGKSIDDPFPGDSFPKSHTASVQTNASAEPTPPPHTYPQR